jgi:hypothetical protein
MELLVSIVGNYIIPEMRYKLDGYF